MVADRSVALLPTVFVRPLLVGVPLQVLLRPVILPHVLQRALAAARGYACVADRAVSNSVRVGFVEFPSRYLGY